MLQILNTLSPLSQLLLILSLFCYVVAQICADRSRRLWKSKFLAAESKREAAEGANRAKAFFLTSMSHEIRAPLNAISAFTAMALRTPLNPELRDYLGTVRASADWLNHVVNEVVDFSRIEAGAVQLSSETFCLSEIVRSAVNIARPLAEQRKLLLRSHLDSALPGRLRGDGTRLLQVIFNLLENALKFTTSGSVLVTAVKESSDRDYATIRIAVADTGIGITPERIRCLFEPLTTHFTALDKRTQTCGFGLPICQRLVQMMGGEMEVQSRPGVGSTFTFSLTLPVIRELAEADAAPANAIAKPRRLRILLAEDDRGSRKLTTLLLRGAGHSVTQASTGMEAVHLFTAGDFELVLMDLGMPDLDGLAATKAIRATEPEGRQVPIYALTAHESHDQKEACLEAGMSGFLSKTLSMEALIDLAASISVTTYQSVAPLSEHWKMEMIAPQLAVPTEVV